MRGTQHALRGMTFWGKWENNEVLGSNKGFIISKKGCCYVVNYKNEILYRDFLK